MIDAEVETQNTCMIPKIEPQSANRINKQHGLLSYKGGLVLHDLLILMAVTLVCCRPWNSAAQFLLNGLMVAATISLAINFRLYSYHLIFSLRHHLVAIGKTFLFALLTLSIVIAIMTIPEETINAYLVPVTLVTATAVVAINRKFNWDLLGLLYPVGFSFFIIGIFESIRVYFPLESSFSWYPSFRMLFLGAVSIIICRTILVHLIFNRLLRKRFRRQVLIVGANSEANTFAKHVLDKNAPFWIAGTVEGAHYENCRLTEVPNKACLGDLRQLPELSLQHKISEIVVTSKSISKHDLIAILDFCTSAGINAWFSPRLMPIIDVKLHIDSFCGKPMIRLCSQKRSWLFYKLKHISDALITLPAFILQMPFFLMIMALIKLESKGPVFYLARAIGKSGSPFNMYKFRSMYVDSDKSIHQQYVTKLIKGEIDQEDAEKGPIKIVQDPRVTKVGRILRKLSLDELPQLINVLKGQMSLVGPRPCLPYEYEIYQDWHKKRTAVRPGITGLWQVTGRSEVLFEDMILLDLYYIYNNSLMLDLQILFETVFVVLGKKGAY